MADILRITTPLVTKNPTQMQKQPNSDEIFSLQDLSKVIKSAPQSELLRQNNGMIQKGDSASVFVDLLKDPSTAVGFLRNILILQEIVGLLPLNNQTVTPEIRQMFEALYVSPQDIVPELTRQENTSTVFKGAFFDFVRAQLTENGDPALLSAATRLMKAVSSTLNRQDILDSVSNSLRYLSQTIPEGTELSKKLLELSLSFRDVKMPEQIYALKTRILPLFKEIENSVFYNPKLAKLLPLVSYNLSRYNDNQQFLPEAAARFLDHLPNNDLKNEFTALLRSVITRHGNTANGDSTYAWGTSTGRAESNMPYSQVMDALVKIVSRQSEDDQLSSGQKSKLEKVICSLLSTPSNFTPLLHFIMPVKFEDMNAFAEIWINPNGEEDLIATGESSEKAIHMLIVFDISEIGQFEAELYVRDHTIDLSLLCPPDFIEPFSELSGEIARSIRGTDYRFGRIAIDKLDRARSLIEVFTALPYRRMGLDIRV